MSNPHHDMVVKLPKEINPYSLVKSLSGIATSWFIFYGTIALVAWLWAQPFSIAVIVPITILIAIIGGYGSLDMGFMGHDAFHFSLHPNKILSCWLGVLAAGPALVPITGFAVSHWNHHKYTNSEKDPDTQIFSRFQNFWSRIFLARPAAYVVYYRNTWALATGQELPYPYTFPLPYNQMQFFARANFAVNLLFLAFHLAILSTFPFLMLPYGLIVLSGSMISGLSPYVEHTNTFYGRGQDTRTSTGIVRDILLMRNNYHIEHHLFPTVPAYNLKRVHQFLKKVGYYSQKRFVTHGSWNAVVTTFSDYKYPKFDSTAP